MKTTVLIAIAALTGVAAEASSIGGMAERRVTVCMESNAHSDDIVRAQILASKIFAGIGLTIDWRLGFRDCPSSAMMISLSNNTPGALQPGAFAYAMPYEGTQIRVFYDRLANTFTRSMVPTVLGHVLAHEITHILQGVCRHSASGMMKANWRRQDFDDMRTKPLPFTSEDIDLIYRGMAGRARAIMARNGAPAAVAVQ
jgi:hypothetical protein